MNTENRRKTEGETLQEALGTYEREDCARFHMPGHKGRGLAGFWRDELAKWDVTEISVTDNLHAPHGAILTAEREMAKAYGAKASFYVVNGSTNAVQAMIFALSQDDKLLLSRDCHRSAVSGAALRGIETETILPRFDEETKLLGMVTPEDLERELERTKATAVLVTSPNAYGLCADVEGLAKAAHRHGALLLVDGAHGAHFRFGRAAARARRRRGLVCALPAQDDGRADAGREPASGRLPHMRTSSAPRAGDDRNDEPFVPADGFAGLVGLYGETPRLDGAGC